MEFSTQLKKLRKDRKLTQAEVAAALNITVRQYQRYESGEQTTTLDNVIALADFFGVSLDYLCGRSEK